MAPKSVTFRRHDHLVSVLFGDLLSHSYNITFSMFLYLVIYMISYVHDYTVAIGGCRGGGGGGGTVVMNTNSMYIHVDLLISDSTNIDTRQKANTEVIH